jgi:hypothetical protein
MRSTDYSWDEKTGADAGRLWAGGAATALVAAGVALVGVMVMHRLLQAPLISPGGMRQSADYAMVAFPIAAALVTLIATALLHLLMATTPSASQFFTWIASLAVILVVLQVFLDDHKILTQVETAAFYFVIGIAIISPLLGVSRTAVRHRRHQAYREDNPADYRGEYRNDYRGDYRNDPRSYR